MSTRCLASKQSEVDLKWKSVKRFRVKLRIWWINFLVSRSLPKLKRAPNMLISILQKRLIIQTKSNQNKFFLDQKPRTVLRFGRKIPVRLRNWQENLLIGSFTKNSINRKYKRTRLNVRNLSEKDKLQKRREKLERFLDRLEDNFSW